MAKQLFLIAAAAAVTTARLTGAAVTFSIDQAAGHSAVSPLIYGGNQSALTGANPTIDRLGGDRWTAYNWTNNASNAGSDYEYSSDNYLGGGSTPGGAVLPFLSTAAAGNESAIITVPINGYVAANFVGPVNPSTPPQSSPNFVPEYPTQSLDPSPASNHVYQNGFVSLVKNNFTASASRPLVFMLDNEPDLWSSTHQEVHPAATTYAELVSKSVAYATMIKQTAPGALVYGPASYGWDGYTTLQDAPDSAANGDFVNYYLKNMAAASTTAGTRLLDALDLHWYPEARGNNASGVSTRITDDDSSPGVVAARLQAPRSLWDPTYSENSYISNPYSQGGEQVGPIQLIPRMQGKIAANYAGTKLSFSEYNYGAGDNISGGVAEADVLGIFGKYGVYSADEWPLLDNEQFINGGMRMFRNYNGANATFGDTEVQANNTDTVNASVYASIDSTNPDHLTVVVINKQMTAQTATLNIANGGVYTSAGIYQLTSANSVPQFVGNMILSNSSSITYTMPAESVTTITMTSNQWLLNTGGSWSEATSWSAGIPDAPAARANLMAIPTGLTAPGTVTLDGNHTVGKLTFSDAVSYTIAPGTGGTLTIDDTGDPSGVSPAITVLAGSHTISAPVKLTAGVTVTTATATKLAISGNITGTGGITANGAGTLVLSGIDDFGPTTVTGGTLNVSGSIASATIVINSGALVTVGGSLSPTAAVTAGGTVVFPTTNMRRNITVGNLTVASTGSVDIAGNDLVVTTGDLTGLTAAVTRGYGLSTGANWRGVGLTSSTAAADSSHLTAVGVIANNQSGSPLYNAGHLFAGAVPAPAAILVKETYFGDANLDGKIDGSDYTLIDGGYASHGNQTGWFNGDFNYDGTIDGSDYALIDNAFNNQGVALVPTALVAAVAGQTVQTAVPEPAVVGALVMIGLVGRHRVRCRP